MSRFDVKIDENKFVSFGFDESCGGYFAQYFDESIQYDPLDEVGFFQGVPKNRVLDFFNKHKCCELAKAQQPDAFNSLILDLAF